MARCIIVPAPPRTLRAAQLLLESTQDRAWQDACVPPGLGLECARYKWRQSQSRVEVFLRLPHRMAAGKVRLCARLRVRVRA